MYSAEEIPTFELISEGFFIITIGFFGILGNVSSIWMFSRQSVHKIFHNLLLVLALFDIVYILCSIHLFSLAKFWPEYDLYVRIPSLPWAIPIAQIGLMGSVYLTVALALERFLAVCYPFLPRRHIYSTRTFVIPVLIFTMLYNIPKFFELTVEWEVSSCGSNCSYPLTNTTTVPRLIPTRLRLNRIYIRVYILWMNILVQIVGPFLVLIGLNVMVYKRIIKFEQTLKDNMRVCFTRSTSNRSTESGMKNMGQDSAVTLSVPTGDRRPSLASSDEYRNTGNVKGSWKRFQRLKSRRSRRQSGHGSNNFNTPRKREVLLSRTSIYIAFMFVICHSVRLVPNTYEMIYTYSNEYDKKKLPWPDWLAKVTNLSHVCLTLVCSSNFFIYYFKHGALCQKRSKNQNHSNVNYNTRNSSIYRNEREVPLTDISSLCDRWKDVPKLFFIESSGRNYLTNRQACSIESALRNSDLPAVVVMLSESLNIGANNATKRLYGQEGLYVLKADLNTLFSDTPFEESTKHLEFLLKGSKNKVVQLSDMMRLALIYKFGGTYSDIDVIFLKSLKNLTNFFSSDQPALVKEGKKYYSSIANGLFNIEKSGSDLVKDSMSYVTLMMKGSDWSSGGAKPISKVLQNICHKDSPFSVEDYSENECQGIVQFLSPELFYPFQWNSAALLDMPRRPIDWEEEFKRVISVDFFHSSSKRNLKILRQKFYGAKIPAMTFLGPLHCPMSYFSQPYY